MHSRSMLALVALAACGSRAAAPPATPPAVPPATPNPGPERPPAADRPGRLQLSIDYRKLDNGLRVVLNKTALPTVVVGVYYHIGFRVEPRDRTGFAHLFEHMMFQGSPHLGKMEMIRLVESNGGILNGSTRFDFTNYFEVAPAGALELLLWAEADRMGGLAVTDENLKNQVGVVSNEVRVNIINQPYGGFPWIDMPQVANQNWFNAHNFYGDLGDLEAAKLDEVKAFYDTHYAPSNAVLVISGGFDPDEAMGLVKKYFGALPTRPRPALPDVTEPPQKEERRKTKVDPLAPRPALAVAWHSPPRRTPEHVAMTAIDALLASGEDSLLHEKLVLHDGATSNVASTMNILGNAYNYEGPMLYMIWFIHDADKKSDDLVAAIDGEIAKLVDQPVDAATLARAKVKLRSDLYDVFEQFVGFGRADLLASFALFDDDPTLVNRLEDDIDALTPEVIQRTAREYLRKENRTVLVVEPAAEKKRAP